MAASLYCDESLDLESAGSPFDDEEAYSDEENLREQQEESEEGSSSGEFYFHAS